MTGHTGKLTMPLTYLKATCGHDVIFTPLPDDPYHETKVAKITGRACRECRLKESVVREAKAKADSKIRKEKKHERKTAGVRELGLDHNEIHRTAVCLMPEGTVIQLQRIKDTWYGAAVLNGRTVRFTGKTPVNVLKKLAAAVCYG
jgi:hypothetical protein